MARLTLSEQVNQQASEIARLTAELHSARAAFTAEEFTTASQEVDLKNLRESLAVVPAQDAKIAALTKELEQEKGSRKYHNDRADKAEAELEQAHSVLDCIEGAPLREFEQEYGKGKRTVVARIAGAMLAVVKAGAAK